MTQTLDSVQASCEDRLQTYFRSIFPDHTDNRPDWTSPSYKRQLFEIFLDCWQHLPTDRFQLEIVVLRRLGERHLSPGDRVQVSLMCRAWQEWAYCLSHLAAKQKSENKQRNP